MKPQVRVVYTRTSDGAEVSIVCVSEREAKEFAAMVRKADPKTDPQVVTQ